MTQGKRGGWGGGGAGRSSLWGRASPVERRTGLWWDPLFPLWCQADSFALGPVVGSTKPEFELGLKNKNK